MKEETQSDIDEMFGECEELHNVMAVEEWLGRAAAHGSAVLQHTHIAPSNVHILLPLRELFFFRNFKWPYRPDSSEELWDVGIRFTLQK